MKKKKKEVTNTNGVIKNVLIIVALVFLLVLVFNSLLGTEQMNIVVTQTSEILKSLPWSLIVKIPNKK